VTFVQWLMDLLQRVKMWTIVQPWERGVRVRLGRWVKKLEPGIHPRIPLIDTVTVLNTRLRVAAMPCLTVMTADGKTMTVAGNVAFTIVDPYLAMMQLSHPEDSCSAFAQRSAPRYIAERPFAAITVADFEATVLRELKGSMPGVEISFVSAVDFCCVKTYRLLQENWRPYTSHTTIKEATT